MSVDRIALSFAALALGFGLVILTWNLPILLREGWAVGVLSVLLVAGFWFHFGLIVSEVIDEFRRSRDTPAFQTPEEGDDG